MIIYRYIAKEILLSLVAVLGVLMLIFVGSHFARYLAEAVAGVFPADLVANYVLMVSLFSMVPILPFAYFIAVLLAFGRLYKDSEMTAFLASGISLARFMRFVTFFSFMYAGVVAAFSFYIAPWAMAEAENIYNQAENTSDVTGVAPGRFQGFGGGAGVFYFESFADADGLEVMDNVFVRNRGAKSIDLFSSEKGYIDNDPASGDTYLVLENGYRYQGQPGSLEYKVYQFEVSRMRLEKGEFAGAAVKLASTPTSELWGDKKLPAVAELQWRFVMPLSVILLAALALLLSYTTPRQGRYAKLFVAMMVYIVFNSLMGVSRSWLEKGLVPPVIGLWWVELLLLAVLIYLYMRQQYSASFGLLIWLKRMNRRAHLA